MTHNKQLREAAEVLEQNPKSEVALIHYRLALSNPSVVLGLLDRIDELEGTGAAKLVARYKAERDTLTAERDALKSENADLTQDVEAYHSDALTLMAERDEAREALKPFIEYFTRAESDAGYLVVNEEETGFSDMREALIAVVFNEHDAESFMGMVERARRAAKAGGTE